MSGIYSATGSAYYYSVGYYTGNSLIRIFYRPLVVLNSPNGSWC